MFTIFRSRYLLISGIHPGWVTLAFGVKILASFFLLYIYSTHYPNREDADVFKYFDEAKRINVLAETDPVLYLRFLSGLESTENLDPVISESLQFWDRSPSLPLLNDNRLLIRFNAIVLHISDGNIHLHMLLAGILGFLGSFFLFKVFRLWLTVNPRLLFIAIFFLPSIVFWTSGVLKEAFMLFGLGGMMYSMIQLSKGMNLKWTFFFIFFFWILSSSKLYVAMVSIAPVICFFWQKAHSDRKIVWRYLVVNILVVGLTLNAHLLLPVPSFKQQLIDQQQEFKCLAEWVGAGSIVNIPDLTNDPYSFIRASPTAIYNTIVRPGLWERLNYLSFPASLEITLILILLIFSMIFHQKPNKNEINILFFGINFVLLLSLLIGWTTPVMGAIVRYRIPILPFLILISFLLVRKDKLPKFAIGEKP